MVKKKLTLLERYRRLKRIMRFLSRRGTLFHSKIPGKHITGEWQRPPRKKVWRPWRKIRYLIKRGSFARKKKNTIISGIPEPLFSQNRKKRSGFSPYLTYRRLRYLINTGRLFSVKKHEPKVKKRKRKIFRKIRFLLKRGNLVKFQSKSMQSDWKKYLGIIIKPDNLKIILNSTILFLLAYVIVFLVTNLTSSMSALTCDIQSVIFYYKIDYLISAKGWKIDDIKIVFSAGPFFSLILSFIVLVLYINVSQETWFIRLFLFWLFCHAFLHFFGEMLIGIMLTKGLGLAISYMLYSEYKKLLIILFSSSCLILAGFLITKIALFSGNVYFNMITRKNRSYFLLNQFLIPFLLGFGILVLVKTPKITEFDIEVNLAMLLLILPIVIRGLSMKDMYFDPDPRVIPFRWKLLLVTGFVILLFRVIFSAGFRIG
jgi:hypothetical protein